MQKVLNDGCQETLHNRSGFAVAKQIDTS